MKLTFRILLLVPLLVAYQAYAEDSAAKGELKSISDLKARKEKDRARLDKQRVVVKAGAKKEKDKPVAQKGNNQKPIVRQIVKPVEKSVPVAARSESGDRIINQSVLFSEEEVTRLNTVYNAYLQTLKNRGNNKKGANSKTKDVLQDIVNKLKPAKSAGVKAPTKVYIKAPAYFYLNSILYRNPNNSTIWINGNQLESSEISDGLSILKVRQDRVDFIWRVIDGQIPLDEWRKKAIERAKGSESKVNVNSNKRFVKFSLGVNQTFNVKEMLITEGKSVVKLEGADNDTLYDPRFPDTRFTPEGRRAYEAQKAEEARRALQVKQSKDKKQTLEVNKKKALEARKRAQQAKKAREAKRRADAAKKARNAKNAKKPNAQKKPN